MEEKEKREKGTLTLCDRCRLTLDGVSYVESFGEEALTLVCETGRLTVEGEGMKIEDLSAESGNIRIVGRIDGLFFTEGREERRSLFGKWGR